MVEANFLGITGLALVDAINPCALAVLFMVLLVLLLQDPNKKNRVLVGGISFTLAIYIGYLIYGLIIVTLFTSMATFFKNISVYIYNGFAILAMLIGALQIKDFFYYKKGSIGTEMPLFMRPKVKKTINNITSVKGTFLIGLFVTLFLLPCTIGPYIVASGLLSQLGTFGALPWLLYYNLIFILPMLIIILLVYFGISRIQELEGWKERNIKKLHLISGILLFLVGISLLLGWI